jgi:polyhydroxyalkanoate synthase
MLRSETQSDRARAEAALAGLRAYQQASRLASPPAPPTVARAGRARLLDYGGTGRPVVVVPSIINGPQVLDLLPEASFLRWLATQGVRPLLFDWGEPTAEECCLSIAGHVETLLHPLLRSIGHDVALAGYCLGGTMALAAAAIEQPRALALIAAPWHFAGFGDEARSGLDALWRAAEKTAETIGLLPLEVLQAGFWRLDPKRTVEKFVRFAAQAHDAAAVRQFVALEDWANGGPPLTLAAGRELVEALFGRDVTGTGAWQVAGRRIDPAAIRCPILDVRSTSDRIVPAASAAGVGRPLELSLGHVGMIVGSRARASLWKPLAAFLRDPG